MPDTSLIHNADDVLTTVVGLIFVSILMAAWVYAHIKTRGRF